MSYEVAVADKPPIIRIMERKRDAPLLALEEELRLTRLRLAQAETLIACVARALEDAGYGVHTHERLWDQVAAIVRERDALIVRARAAESVQRNVLRKLQQCQTSA